MEFHFTAIAQLILEHIPGEKMSKHAGINFMLEPSEDLDRERYIDDEDNLTFDGLKVMRQVLISALAATIHDGHQRKLKDSAEALRESIAQLETEFVQIAHIEPGEFKPL
jgi:hypothetical protein